MAKSGSWLLPLLYVGGLGIVFYLFTRWNKLRLKLQATKYQVDSYFGRNFAKEAYEELSEQYPIDSPEGLQILKTALMKRAVVGVQRIWQIREEKQPLSQLVKQGAVGEELYEKIVKAEEELELEVQDIMEEADLYKQGWKQTIFQEATQLLQAQMASEARSASEASPTSNGPSSPTSSASSPSNDTPGETEEQKRERLAQELIEEEEREKRNSQTRRDSASKKNNKKKK